MAFFPAVQPLPLKLIGILESSIFLPPMGILDSKLFFLPVFRAAPPPPHSFTYFSKCPSQKENDCAFLVREEAFPSSQPQVSLFESKKFIPILR